MLSGRGLCDGLITRLEESYRLWRVLVCELETSRVRRLKLVRVVNAVYKKKKEKEEETKEEEEEEEKKKKKKNVSYQMYLLKMMARYSVKRLLAKLWTLKRNFSAGCANWLRQAN